MNSMICHVIVEGQTDLALMEHLLPQYRDSVNFVVAGGSSRAVSLGRMILASHKEPIVLVMDADEYKPDFANERREEVEAALRQFGSSRRFHVVFFVPEMEAVLLHDDDGCAALTGGKSLSIEDRILAKYEPTKVIAKLAQDRGVPAEKLIRDAIERMNPSAALAQESFEGLEAFLQRWTSAAA